LNPTDDPDLHLLVDGRGGRLTRHRCAFSCKVFVENADGAQAEDLAGEHPQFRRVIREGRRRLCGAR
jgi:hypothetical protein